MLRLSRSARILSFCMAALGSTALWAAPSAATNPAPAARADRSAKADDATTRSIIARSAGVYDALAGELYAQRSDLSRAYAYLMDGARRTGDTRLYARAAEIALRARAPDAALKAVQSWKAVAPKDAEADSYQLQILMLLGQVEQSAPALSQALANAAPDKRAAMIHAIPMLYGKAKDPQEALRIVEQAVTPYRHAPETAFVSAITLARMQVAARQYPQAMANLQQSQHMPVSSAKLGSLLPNRELPALIAMDVLRMSRTSAPATARQAEALIRTAVQRQDASEDLQLIYAQVLLESMRYNDSLAQLKQLIKRHPDNATAWMLQGGIQVQSRQWDAADASLQHYLQLRAAEPQSIESGEDDKERQIVRVLHRVTAASSDIQAYLMLAEIADARNQPEAAAQWIKRIQPASARNTAMLQRAEMLSQKGQYAQALELTQNLPVANAQDRTIKALLQSRIEEKAGHLPRAMEILNQALIQNKDDAEMLYARGSIHEKLDNHSASEQDMRRVMALRPESPTAYNALGYGLAERNQRLDEAKALVAKALKLDPENAAIQDSMGWVEYKLGNLQEARRWLEQAFNAEPQAEIAAHLGEVLWKQGEHDKARSIWQQGLKIDSKDPTLLQTMQRFPAQP